MTRDHDRELLSVSRVGASSARVGPRNDEPPTDCCAEDRVVRRIPNPHIRTRQPEPVVVRMALAGDDIHVFSSSFLPRLFCHEPLEVTRREQHPHTIGPEPSPPQPAAPAAPLSISEPLTKAQRILGTTAISLDLAGATSDTTTWGPWDGQSNPGISINVTETPAGRDNARSRLGSARRDDARHGSSGNRDRRWEEESAVLPKDNMTGPGRRDDTTDASSLRRQQSSSTIRSYYDKAKVPLAISQQTANSAMAKGLPSKAHAILDFDGNYNTEPKGLKKKKPSRLDLSSLLSKRSHRHLRPEPGSGHHVLSSDKLTTSPSVTSSTSAPTPPPLAQRIDRKLRNKMTQESLREQAPTADSRPSPISSAGRSDTSAKQIPIRPNAELHNLYDHYEQKTFDEALEHNYRQIPERRGPPPDRALPAYPTPPTSNTGKPSLSPFPRSASRTGQRQDPPSPLTVAVPDVHLVRPPSVPSLVSPVAECASISSRHTRTSKASKRTDRSLTEIDLLQNSVLALSSDSEDDYDACSDQLAVPPPPSDGPASPVSPRSAMSQPSFTRSEDSSRSKACKQTTFAENHQYLPSREQQQAAARKQPKPNQRTSSLAPHSTTNSLQIYPPPNRTSNGTTGTARTLGYSASQTPTTHEAKAINMVPKSKFQDQAVWSVPEETQFEDFPAPPIRPAQRPAQPSRPEQTPPLSPTSVDFYLQSQRSSSAQDNGSIASGGSRGSGNRSGRRGSAASSIQDGQSGRFMAVTRQEEMLLAALRQKRARMREDILAEYEDDADREEHQALKREVTNDSSGLSMISRQSSLSTNTGRVETNPLTARPPPHDSVRSRTSSASAEQNGKHGHILVMMDESNSDIGPLAQLDDFPAPAESDRRGSKSSGRSGPPHKQRASLSAMSMPTASARRPPRSGSLPRRASSDQASVHSANAVNNSLPNQILEDPAEDEEDEGIPRPDSPISPSDFPVPMSANNPSTKIVNKKHLRLSAFGTYKPNVEAGWWDDSG
ncbi:hypothetical protein QBC40DRAFT_348031 [Triangularia verruculosa]|uniref:Uncharacterized protein n=1 Tax=Triangularia verruculosa TaxID=2587418 RepID=A0AAN6XI32_9PEZI|nr:hypothetical protein QBC40DRAFT_348031 [Triangularia verruculosa]